MINIGQIFQGIDSAVAITEEFDTAKAYIKKIKKQNEDRRKDFYQVIKGHSVNKIRK